MSKEKKLSITMIILAAMLPVSFFGLSFISEEFLTVGMYCGISALLCLFIYLDLKEGKKPNLIPIGLGMAFFGFVFLGVWDSYQIVSITLSALYAVAGLLTLAKGIKGWYDGKRNRPLKVKKSINKKIYIGIGLLVGGFFATIILFNILPVLMAIGHVMVVVGFVILGRGIAERKNGLRGAQPVNSSCTTTGNAKQVKTERCARREAQPVNSSCTTTGNAKQVKTEHCARREAQPVNSSCTTTGNAKQVKTEHCARCKKNLTHLSNVQIFTIDGLKYCADCETAIEQEIKNQQMVCSVCGVDISVENMHVIDDALVCHSCFLNKYGNIDSYDEEETGSTIDDAVSSLRNRIIAEIIKNPAVKYQLSSLLWEAAASCFPKSGFQWDGAWFELDLKSGKLYAKVSTYPNQFGACREDTFSLSAAEFNRIAKQFNMSRELQAFNSDEDWAKLFDNRLKAVISSTCATLQKKEEYRKSEEIKKRAVKIPAKYAKQTPVMCLSEITIEISQRYSSRSIEVSNANGNYQVVYVRNSHMSLSDDRHTRTLSIAEAVWLEKRVESTIENSDETTWQSLPGGDTMNIVIKRNKGNDITLRGVKPIRKYSDLQNELENMAQYGSLSVH